MMKLALKRNLARAGQRIGLFRTLRALHHKDAFVLAYHRILPSLESESIYVQPGMYVSTKSFSLQMSFLKANFDIIPLPELVDRVAGGKDVSGCCCITFDDGWLDNYDHAFPVLMEMKIPATIFLATGYIETERLFWPERLARCLCRDSIDKFLKEVPLLKGLTAIRSRERGASLPLDAVIEEIKGWSVEKRDELMTSLEQCGEPAGVERLLMNWDEVRSIVASGLVTIGSHTKTHVILDQVPPEKAEDEIALSRDDIKEQLGFVPDLFAYPNGNVTSRLQEILYRYGFRGGFSTRRGWFRIIENRYDIPRICMHEDVSSSIPLFQARLHLRGF